MGRGGYAHVKQKMIENKEIKPDEEPLHGIMWLKGRVNKDGQFLDDKIRSVGDKLKETEDKIKEGTLKVEHDTDALTVVLGKEKGGYARGVGSGVTYKRYFDLPRSRQASDERIAILQKETFTKLMNQLAAQGEQLQSMSNKLTPSDVSLVDINLIDNSTDEEGETPLSVVGCENDASIQKSNGLATSEKEMETRDCYKVSVDKSLVDAACIPDVGNNVFKTVKDACLIHAAFVTIQMNVENKTAPKLYTKRKNVYVSSDAMQRQAKKKNLQKSLNY
ncbi:hypothetical protein Tco_1026727 [Tanacetum coccineum]